MTNVIFPDSGRATTNDQDSALHWLLGAALALGLAADILIWDHMPAVSGFALWVLCFTGAFLVLLVRRSQQRPAWQRLLWIAVPPLAAGLLVLRAHEAYVLLMLMLMTLATSMVVALGEGGKWQDLRAPQLLLAFLRSGLALVIGLPLVLQSVRNVGSIKPARTQVTAWLRGLILTLPLLALFTTLFYLADAGFSHLLDSAGHFVGAEAGSHLLRIGIFTWICGGLLYALLSPGPAAPSSADPATAAGNGLVASLGREEITVIMGSLCVLFISFTLLQLGYLFGGSGTIEATPGLTVAEYARRGFFELLAVSVLTLLVLMALGCMSRDPRRFRVLAAVLLGCVFIMQISAMQRLTLYIDHFGLTLARWLAAWMLLWIAGVLVWFGASLWHRDGQAFIFGSATMAAALLLLCVASNPAARVATVNLNRHIETNATLDSDYLMQLGTDAVPAILSRITELEDLPRCELTLRLLVTADSWQQEARSWRHFSFSRWRAERAMAEQRAALEAIRLSPVSCRIDP